MGASTVSIVSSYPLRASTVYSTPGRIFGPTTLGLSTSYVLISPTVTVISQYRLFWTQTLTMRSRIQKRVTKTFDLRSRIAKSRSSSIDLQANIVAATRTIDFKSRIKGLVEQNIRLKARILYPRLTNIKLRAFINRRNDINLQARIINTLTQTIDAQARIQQYEIQGLSLRAFIVKLSKISLQANIRNTTNQSMYMMADIISTINETIQMKGRISSYLRDLSMKAKISYDIWFRARIASRQGWPIPGIEDDNFLTFVATQLRMRAFVLGPLKNKTNLQLRSKIRLGGTKKLDMMGTIVKAGFISMRSYIVPRITTRRVTVFYQSAQPRSSRVRMVFYSHGFYTKQSLQMKTKIVTPKSERVNISFMVPVDYSQLFQTLSVVVSETSRQHLYMRARIG